jgi:hypothetical protein
LIFLQEARKVVRACDWDHDLAVSQRYRVLLRYVDTTKLAELAGNFAQVSVISDRHLPPHLANHTCLRSAA